MIRLLAVDNHCAWPNLTRLPDGSIVATIFDQPCHGNWEGSVVCWATEDGGHFWRYRGTPAPFEPGTNRMNVAAGLAANGDLLVLASGWTNRPRRGAGIANHAPPAHTLPSWICRSRDGGRTWSRLGSILPPTPAIQSAIPFGDIIRLPNGQLGVCIYTWQPPEHRHSWFYTSADDGLSWTPRGQLCQDQRNETAPLALPNGELLACARTLGDQHLELFRSRDLGQTWVSEQAVSEGMQHPAHLHRLRDGRILLAFGDRRPEHWGIVVRLSEDHGHSWSEPRRLVALERSDLGYPATADGPDGTLVTAWYSSGVAAHQRYHMGCAIWRLEELFPGA